MALIFDRRINSSTPGTFRTKVITSGVDPQISCYYKSSRIKQYFKEHRALRTETVICDTRDFGIGRRVNAENWKALRAVGEHANQRLCDAQAADARPAPDVATLTEVTLPSTHRRPTRPRAAFGDPRVMAVLAAIVGFTHLLAGFDNPTLVRAVEHPAGHARTPAARPPTICAGSNARGSSSGCRATTATNSPRWAAASPSCSPRSTDASSAPGLAELDPRLPTDLANRSDLAHGLAPTRPRLNQFTNAALTAA